MKYLEVIVPVKNEQASLEELVKRIDTALNSANIEYGITFVDDHSSDGTAEILKELSKIYPVKFFTKRGKPGKAYSILEGAAKSKAEYIAMIDGDLQYAPEILPEMFRKLAEHGVVVAKRKIFKVPLLRKLISKTFSLAFGKLMFGIKADVQSGLKVFRKEILSYIDPKDITPWTLDLPLLHTALELGYTIGEVDMDFKERKSGESKINLLGSIFEIGSQSLKLKLKRKKIYPIDPDNENTMRGAGVIYKRKRFITHTSLEHQKSAIRTFYSWQKAVFFLVILNLVLGLLVNFLLTLQITIAILSLIYCIDVFFNLFLILKSLHFPPEISFTDAALDAIDESKLPVYSILCPLYREAHVIPHFIEAISKLDWPKDKLDVQLLLEEDDVESIEAVKNMDLPFYVRVNVVPDSLPKTKPKACNFGLLEATGEYVVIYDAEDVPEPKQLKKAYLAFKKSLKRVICMQAKLNYFNPHQNLLTKFFTAEYSLWFDVILPGFQSIGTNIPLGGTSNHFKKKALMKIEGWDPFNVTEDCDLGIRLFMDGYQTAVIDSTTLEEANSDFKNWIRQRSRWIKGYMQTYLVHMRNPGLLLKNQGLHFLIFQLVIGARVTFGLINPILWAITISYFTMRTLVGPSIEALYPAYVFYPAVFSLVFGNFSYLYYYMIGSAKREHYGVIKYVFLIPFYWVMWSIASFMALYQLITKPHFWEKTVHGLHLQKVQVVKVAEEKIEVSSKRWSKNFEFISKNKKLFVGGGMLVFASMVGNLCNFIFNAYLGRSLSLEDFGDLSLFTSFLYLSSIPLGAFSTTVTHKIAFLFGKYSKGETKGYLKYLLNKSIIFAIFLTGLWVLLIPLLQRFFNTESAFPFLVFTPVWMIGVVSANFGGLLKGTLSFGIIAAVAIVEAVLKLILAFAFVYLNLSSYVFLSIPFSLFISMVLLILLSNSKEKTVSLPKLEQKFNKPFFVVSVLNGLSNITFLTLDVILVKHFMSSNEAGQYGLLSLVGKMTFFFGSLFGPFMIPIVSRNEGAKTDSKKVFSFLFFSSLFFAIFSVLMLGVFGDKIVPLLFGAKTIAILPLLPIYVLAIGFFTVTQPVISYFQAKENYAFALTAFLVSIIQITLINFFHADLKQVVLVMFSVSAINLALMGVMYLLRDRLWVFDRALADFSDLLFSPFKFDYDSEKNLDGKLQVLIFNWRDTKHRWAGGAEAYIHEIAKGLNGQGLEVTVFCGNDGHNPRYEVVDGVQVIRRGGFYMVYFWAVLYYVLRLRNKFDVVIDSENGIPFFTPLYVRKPKFLLIHHVHQEVFRNHLSLPLALLATFLEGKLMPFVYRNQNVVTVSDSSKKEFLGLSKNLKEISIVNPGINHNDFITLPKTKYPTILYLGRLQPYKNIDIAIKAFKLVLEKYPKAKFNIAGNGVCVSILKQLVQKLGIEESVNFLGKVSEKEKIKLLAKSWVMIQPSMVEGWGITVVEANACGTPVIASNVNGLKDSIVDGKTGILVKPKSVEEFSNVMERIVKNKKLRQKLSQKALTWSKNFSWDKSAQDFKKFIYIAVDEDRSKKSLSKVIATESGPL